MGLPVKQYGNLTRRWVTRTQPTVVEHRNRETVTSSEMLLHVGPNVPQRRQRQREVIAFMTQAEIDADDLSFIKNRFTLQAAIQSDFLCKLDPRRCLTGVCTDF